MRQMSIISRLRKENRATYDASRRKTRIKGEWMREDWFAPNYVLGKRKKKDGLYCAVLTNGAFSFEAT